MVGSVLMGWGGELIFEKGKTFSLNKTFLGT